MVELPVNLPHFNLLAPTDVLHIFSFFSNVGRAPLSRIFRHIPWQLDQLILGIPYDDSAMGDLFQPANPFITRRLWQRMEIVRERACLKSLANEIKTFGTQVVKILSLGLEMSRCRRYIPIRAAGWFFSASFYLVIDSLERIQPRTPCGICQLRTSGKSKGRRCDKSEIF